MTVKNGDHGECDLWKVKYWGSVYLSEVDNLDKVQTVFVVAGELEDAIKSVREMHDEHGILISVKRVARAGRKFIFQQ